MPGVRIERASAAAARAQAAWIVGMEPWRGLGYRQAPLARYLARVSGEGEVWIARAQGARRGGAAVGLVVVTPGFLLGDFIALLAVRAEAAGRGIGRALVAHVAARTARRRRWLFVSSDAGNRRALRFYRAFGFARVGRLPDLVAPGHVEILLRKRV